MKQPDKNYLYRILQNRTNIFHSQRSIRQFSVATLEPSIQHTYSRNRSHSACARARIFRVRRLGIRQCKKVVEPRVQSSSKARRAAHLDVSRGIAQKPQLQARARLQCAPLSGMRDASAKNTLF